MSLTECSSSSPMALTGRVCSPGRRSKKVTSAFLLVTFCSFGLAAFALSSATPASAAVTHEYEPGPSEKLSEGVPNLFCETLPETVPPCISGPLNGASAIAPDGAEHVWVADATKGVGRVDRFNATSGAFEGPQLVEEGGMTGLGSALAVGHAFASEQVYVKSAQGFAVFDAGTGKLAGSFTGAKTFNGGFSGEARVAVDGSALSPAKGDVYVTTQAGNVVDVFSTKKAEEETLKAGEEPAPVAELPGTCETPEELLPCTSSSLIPFGYPRAVAVSPLNGDLIVSDEKGGARALDVFRPEPLGGYAFVRQITEIRGVALEALGEVRALAVDGNGDIFAAQGTSNLVSQLDSEGSYRGHLTGIPSGAFSGMGGMGVDPLSNRVFVAGGETPAVSVFGETLTIPDVATTEATEVHATHVQLNGTVKLDGAGPAKCSFDYGTTKAYEKTVPCKPPEVTELEETELGGAPVPVNATIEGLEPDTSYFYRVKAINGSHIPSTGEGPEDEGTFTTTGPGRHGEGSSEVSSSAATLDASIDPNGSATSYYFQYNTTGTGPCEATPADCTSIPTAPEPIGSTATPEGIRVSQHIQGLESNKTYHYRLVVVSEPEPGVREVFPEPDATFTTQLPGTGFHLPDGRQWELVSPPDKHGALLQPIASQLSGGITQASLTGGAITYLGIAPTEENPPGFPQEEQILSTRGAAGWSSRDISLPHSSAVSLSVGIGSDYRFFSKDLSLAVAESFEGFTSLKPEVFPPDDERTPYLRHDLTCSATPSTCYQPLLTSVPGYSDIPEGTNLDEVVVGGRARFAAASPDLAHILLNSEVGLKTGDGGGLYEWSAGKPLGEEELMPVSVLPAGEGGGTVGATVGGTERASARGAVSTDGSRVAWRPTAGGALYLRLNAAEPQSATGAGGVCTEPGKGCTIRLDVPQCLVQEGCTGSPTPVFQIANSDGSRILFTDTQPLVKGAGTRDVYECEVLIPSGGGPRCMLRDVAPGANVVGQVLGASEDGSTVYFVSNSVVGDGGARGASTGDCTIAPSPTLGTAESCGLYAVHYDAAKSAWKPAVFIATLSANDALDWSGTVSSQTARVSPDGTWLTFMSDRSLTGYDNRDAHSGKPDEEVYLYDSRTEKLACASCDPTAARPDGIEAGGRSDRLITTGMWQRSAWLAANIPGWTPYESEAARYHSRFLSNDGRLFFNSSDALVPQDVNNQEDVYEWEPAGVGGCSPSAPGFEPATGGCVALISSGTSSDESAFLDASENGSDVFFLTSEKLVSQDVDTAQDVYDAHVCGAEGVPCTPQAAAPPECANADSCRSAPSPQPGVFGAPASATFSGPANAAPPPPPVVKAKTAAQIRAEKLSKALKACRKKRRGHKRALCEKQAKKKYGAVKASARKATRKGTR
jgi:DNA-binding beta-propeller fold protein YncE